MENNTTTSINMKTQTAWGAYVKTIHCELPPATSLPVPQEKQIDEKSYINHKAPTIHPARAVFGLQVRSKYSRSHSFLNPASGRGSLSSQFSMRMPRVVEVITQDFAAEAFCLAVVSSRIQNFGKKIIFCM
jgi:hypothetical protein